MNIVCHCANMAFSFCKVGLGGIDIPMVGEILSRTLDKSAYQFFFIYFSFKTYVVGTLLNRLNETVLLSTQNK